MSSTRLFYASVFLLVAFMITSSKAQSDCVPSSCGDIRHIAFPFRLRSDPQHCGEPGYELQCQNNQTVFDYRSKSFFVQDINYKSFSIRLLDPGLKEQKENCSVFPERSARFGALTSEILEWLPVDININYVNCLAPISSSQYIPTTFCSTNSSSNSSYLVIGELQVLGLEKRCRIETVAWSSAPGISSPNNSSLSSIHRGLAHGFELSWKRNLLCRECEASRGFCTLEENSDIATCTHHCSEDTPVSELSFRCKIKHYSVFVLAYGGIGIVGSVAIRLLLGIPILIAVVVWQCKRRNLYTSEESLEDKACQPSSSNEQNC